MAKKTPVIKLRKPSARTAPAAADNFVSGGGQAAVATAAAIAPPVVEASIAQAPLLTEQEAVATSPTVHVVEEQPMTVTPAASAPVIVVDEHAASVPVHVIEQPTKPMAVPNLAVTSRKVMPRQVAPKELSRSVSVVHTVPRTQKPVPQAATPRSMWTPGSADDFSVVPRKRTVVQRKDGRNLHRTTVYLAPDLSKRLAMHALQEDRTQSEIIAAALAAYLR